MPSNLYSNLLPLYKTYNEVVKPLVAEIEVRYELFPMPVYNEIRAFNDHVARCYNDINDIEFNKQQIIRANSHIERIVLDCYKFLNVKLYDSVITTFKKRTKGVDLHSINNGIFYIEYKKNHQFIVENLKKAKLKEIVDKELAISLYQEVHNKYTELESLLIDNDSNINWAIATYYSSSGLRFIAWLAAAIISGIISSSIIPWACIYQQIKSFIVL